MLIINLKSILDLKLIINLKSILDLKLIILIDDLIIVKPGSCSSLLKALNSTLKESTKKKEQSWHYNPKAPTTQPPPTLKAAGMMIFSSQTKPNERYFHNFSNDFSYEFSKYFQNDKSLL